MTLHELVQSVLTSRDFPHEVDESTGMFTMYSDGAEGDEGGWFVIVRPDEEREQIMVLSLFPVPIPIERRPAVMEFLTRANYGLVIGSFEMDLDDGEVRYKTSIDGEHLELTDAAVGQLIGANFTVMDQYIAALAEVAAGQTSPDAAIAAAEAD